jgi:hypothetical protein
MSGSVDFGSIRDWARGLAAAPPPAAYSTAEQEVVLPLAVAKTYVPGLWASTTQGVVPDGGALFFVFGNQLLEWVIFDPSQSQTMPAGRLTFAYRIEANGVLAMKPPGDEVPFAEAIRGTCHFYADDRMTFVDNKNVEIHFTKFCTYEELKDLKH